MKKKTYLLALIPFAIIVLLFELIPIIMVVMRSFMPEGEFGFTLQHYISIFSKPLYQKAMFNSLLIAIGSSLVGIIVAFFGAKAYHASDDKGKSIFASLLNMTSNFSGIPLAFGYIILLGNVGVLVMIGKTYGIEFLASFNVYSTVGLLLCYIYFQIPLATLLLAPAFEGLKKEWREAVSLLGGSGFVYWIKVAIPNLIPGILGTFSVLFANAIAAYATAYALMLNNFSLLPISISEQFVGDVVQRPEFGSALAVVLMMLMVISILLNNYVIAAGRKKEVAE